MYLTYCSIFFSFHLISIMFTSGFRLMSAYKKGYAFELTCKHVLELFSIHLYQRGGAGDLGVDLIGVWQLDSKDECLNSLKSERDPSKPWTMINVVVQCKHEKKPCKPSYVRELDGVISRWNSEKSNAGYFIPPNLLDNDKYSCSHSDIPVIGILASSSGFSVNSITALQYSKNPMIFMTVEPPESLDEPITASNVTSSKLQYCKFNRPVQNILPSLTIGNTFTAGTDLESSQPSIVLINNDIDVSTISSFKE